MRITSFKEGEIITRNEPITYGHNGCKDSSYCGDRITFRGVDEHAKIIFFTKEGWDKDVYSLSYARDAWDEGWTFYPVTMWEKIKELLTL